uniref:hypothetical protein n=1 Tax=Burkholderia sp. AU33423 TaxID=2015355 RepID=UPI00211B4823|nr:hypothetical protein [Burkholderia sp. AU33423]
MGRPLVQHNVCIDLPGEAVSCRAETDLTVLLRKHRDVVFDIKLHAGATYTVTTTHPDRPTGRFYDTKRKVNTGETTFKDGESCHIWIGRNFEGSLILKQGEKVLGRYPISKMDYTNSCTDDPKDKPAPMFITLHDDQKFVKDLLALSEIPELSQRPVSPLLASGFEQAKARLNEQKFNSALGQARRAASAPVPYSEAKVEVPTEGLPAIHAFKIKQTSGPEVPPELTGFFKSGADAYKWDPFNTLSRNFLLSQIPGFFGYMTDTIWKGPLKGFWNRTFIIQRDLSGEFTLIFSTAAKETKIVGYLLGVYKTVSTDVKVMTIAGGTGSLAGTKLAAKGAAKASVLPTTATGKALGVTIAMDYMAWLHDYEPSADGGPPKRDLGKLFASVISDTSQMWMTTYITTWIVSLLFAGGAVLAGGAAVGASIGTIALGTVALIVIVGYAVAVMFNVVKFNDHITELYHLIGSQLEKKLPGDYGNSYSQSSWQVFPLGATP